MNSFRQALQESAFTITAEISGPGEASADEVLRQAETLATTVDGIQVAESRPGQVQTSPVALASLLLRNGIDPVPRVSCRDRNRIALQSDLLGLRALGVTSLILEQGNRIPGGSGQKAKPVFDVNCRELVAMASALNEEEWSCTEHEFLIGTSAAVSATPADWDAKPLLALASAGARFLQARACFDSRLLRRYMDHLVDAKITWSFSVIVTLAPLLCVESARWLQEHGDGASIPATVWKMLDNSSDPERTGIDFCAGLMREFSEFPGVSGLNLLTMGNPGTVRTIIDESGVLRKTSR